jgi:hypothetical protein
MNDLEAQVERGQTSLGRLIRQFCIVNEFKHVQLMQMANSLTGIRWLHSSQISTLKRGAAKNLTGFPLYSLALVNKRIWEVNNGTGKRPTGTRPDDWLGKQPMLREDGTPLDIGDFWRIYFGEMDAPFFHQKDTIEVDDELATVICGKLGQIFSDVSKELQGSQIDAIEKVIDDAGVRTKAKARLLKGVFLGVSELDAAELKENADTIASIVSSLKGKEFKEQDVYELCLDERDDG